MSRAKPPPMKPQLAWAVTRDGKLYRVWFGRLITRTEVKSLRGCHPRSKWRGVRVRVTEVS